MLQFNVVLTALSLCCVLKTATSIAAEHYPYALYNEGTMEPQTSGWELTEAAQLVFHSRCRDGLAGNRLWMTQMPTSPSRFSDT